MKVQKNIPPTKKSEAAKNEISKEENAQNKVIAAKVKWKMVIIIGPDFVSNSITGFSYIFTGSNEFDGFLLVNEQDKGNCLHCHTTDADALGTTRKFANNGLDFVRKVEDFEDLGKGGFSKKNTEMGLFKIPSLESSRLKTFLSKVKMSLILSRRNAVTFPSLCSTNRIIGRTLVSALSFVSVNKCMSSAKVLERS